MPTARGYSQSTLPTIFFIATASCVISAVAGFGTFQIKILSVDFAEASPPCVSGSSTACKVNDDRICRNNTVIIKACLSHHQLPLSLAPECTLGRAELTVPLEPDLNGETGQWRPLAVMSIPFTFSWSGGFTLSLSVSWSCQVQGSTDSMVISSIAVADHISPGSRWTSFISHTSYFRESQPHKLQNPRHRSGTDSSDNTHQLSAPNSADGTNEIPVTVTTMDVNEDQKNFSLDKSSFEVSAKGDRHSHIQRREETHSIPRYLHLVAGQSDVSRIDSKQRLQSREDVAVALNGEEGDLPSLSTSAVVRGQGGQMAIAVRVVCQEHYFGNSCSRLCRPRNDLLGHYGCSKDGQRVCLQGWIGADCLQAVCSERCVPSRGICTGPNLCSCRHGWFGEHCDRCRSYPGCKHGSCHLPGQCVCHKGWTGPLCDVEELYCLEHSPCQNGGTCHHDGSHNYTCLCPAGFMGTHCEVPVCHDYFCLHGGTCHVAEGTRYCLCSPSFIGPRCQHRQANTALPPLTSACSGPKCSPVKPQSLGLQSPCSGTSCLSELVTGGVPCQGKTCYNGGTCVHLSYSDTYTCDCPNPFTGVQCLQIASSCDSGPCKNGGTCTTLDPVSGLFVCVCAPGYSGSLCDVHVVQHLAGNTVCEENVVCRNGGHCERWPRSGQFFCRCLGGFTGEFCEIDETNPCSGFTCLHGGSCVVDEDKQGRCACKKGYTGDFCQGFLESACTRVICQNGGTCIEHDGHFVCACRNKFEGILCEKRFKRRETALTVRMETLTIKDERLTVNVHATLRSTGLSLGTHFAVVCVTVLQSLIYVRIVF